MEYLKYLKNVGITISIIVLYLFIIPFLISAFSTMYVILGIILALLPLVYFGRKLYIYLRDF